MLPCIESPAIDACAPLEDWVSLRRVARSTLTSPCLPRDMACLAALALRDES